MPDLPVAAPDHARRALNGERFSTWEQHRESTIETDATEYVKTLESERAALLAERQQDKERIERLETALERIALGITGRRADYRAAEHDRGMPLTDWHIARAALAVEEDAAE